FLNLEFGLPVEGLVPAIRSWLAGENTHRDLNVPATNRRGAAIQCTVTLTPLVRRPTSEVRGVILLMEEQRALEGVASESTSGISSSPAPASARRRWSGRRASR